MSYGFYITDKGRELLTQSTLTENKVEITKACYGSGGNPETERNYAITSLINQFYEKDLEPGVDSYKIDESDPTQICIMTVVPNDVSGTINEIGYKDSSDNLIIYGIVQERKKDTGTSAESYQLKYENWIKISNADVENLVINVLSPEVEFVTEQMKSLEKTVNGFDGRIVKMEETVNGYNETITQVESKVAGYDSAISDMQSTVDGVDGRIGDIETKVDGYDSTISGIQDTVSGYDTRLGDVESSVSDIESKVNGLDTNYAKKADLTTLQNNARQLVPSGTQISDGSKNLNTTEFLKKGNYYCPMASTAQSLGNCPTTHGFMMEVLLPLNAESYVVRIITDSVGDQYFQNANSRTGSYTYSAWEKYVRSSEIEEYETRISALETTLNGLADTLERLI